ncbi:MAG: plastocyanin/azurin family copper-binding protein [Thermoprotei archaeon]|nr:plastocyanin/azurin family copper-binding protein [TACK group archaeon]
MKNRYALIVVLSLLAIGASSLIASAIAGNYPWAPTHGELTGEWPPGSGSWMGSYGGSTTAVGPSWGMMGGRFGAGEGLETLTISQSVRLLHHVLPGTAAFPSNNSVVVYSSDADLIVFTMGHERAINLTGAIPPAHATHDAFVVDGLIDPTIVFENPSTVNVTTVNLDSSMYHNFVITRSSPPYPYNAMPYEMAYGMVPFLPPAEYSAGQAYSYSYSVQIGPGNYWYLCTYPGHAEMGMYGQLVVR